jgi:response regulator of citrate/malate metabolism
MVRVLIVEDDGLNQKLLARVIGGMEGFVIVATCATLEEVKSIPDSILATINVATVDGRFPEKKGGVISPEAGRLAAEYLRKINPQVKIIAISGTEVDPPWADTSLGKPFSMDELRAVLATLASSIQPEPS